MFKFFRKIRRRLLKENKGSRYALYALGEVFLVVIGILIALQINNWNADRKDRITGEKYLRELRSEAKANADKLDLFLERAHNYVEKVDKIYLSESTLPYILISIEQLDSIGILRQTYFIIDDTYQEIISNGQLNLIPESIKSSLMEINAFFKQMNKIDDKAVNSLNAQQLKMADYFELRRKERSNDYSVILDDSSNKKVALLAYKNYINFCYDWMKNQVQFYGSIQQKYLDLIDRIDMELD